MIILATALSLLYSSLDPTSVAQHFAFYELYPTTNEGRDALRTAWNLLSGNDSDPEMILPQIELQPLINFVNRTRDEASLTLPEDQLQAIEKLSRHLQNRKLKGFGLWDETAILQLPPEEIDLARGMLLAESGAEEKQKLRSYEATLDLMALQILARLSPDATDLEKIYAINNYIFSEMRFRFPPHSLHAKEIDVYTFLPSVLDGRRGVCLGVSILYLCLSQRLGLNLEAITPPGHIYVRYAPENGEIVNIETTARGIDIPSERYLGLETHKLQKRDIKQVIGLAFMNQAAVYWHKKDHKTAVHLYEKAKPFVGDDLLLDTFLGLNYLFIGENEKGKELLTKTRGRTPDYAISTDTVAEDYLTGAADVEALQTVFSEVDERRSSILEKQKKLESTTKKWPKFRQGWFHLAITHLQLGREKEALPILEKYISLAPDDATANYYISAIHFQRRNFNQAWKYLRAAEKITTAKNHSPRVLTELKNALQRACPEP